MELRFLLILANNEYPKDQTVSCSLSDLDLVAAIINCCLTKHKQKRDSSCCKPCRGRGASGEITCDTCCRDESDDESDGRGCETCHGRNHCCSRECSCSDTSTPLTTPDTASSTTSSSSPVTYTSITTDKTTTRATTPSSSGLSKTTSLSASKPTSSLETSSSTRPRGALSTLYTTRPTTVDTTARNDAQHINDTPAGVPVAVVASITPLIVVGVIAVVLILIFRCRKKTKRLGGVASTSIDGSQKNDARPTVAMISNATYTSNPEANTPEDDEYSEIVTSQMDNLRKTRADEHTHRDGYMNHSVSTAGTSVQGADPIGVNRNRAIDDNFVRTDACQEGVYTDLDRSGRISQQYEDLGTHLATATSVRSPFKLVTNKGQETRNDKKNVTNGDGEEQEHTYFKLDKQTVAEANAVGNNFASKNRVHNGAEDPVGVYFVLEKENAVMSDNARINNCTRDIVADGDSDEEYTGDRDYFVLEKEKPRSSDNDRQNNGTRAEDNEEEYIGDRDYFVLEKEKHDTSDNARPNNGTKDTGAEDSEEKYTSDRDYFVLEREKHDISDTARQNNDKRVRRASDQ